MSIEDLHDIAAQLHKFAEDGGMHRAPTLQRRERRAGCASSARDGGGVPLAGLKLPGLPNSSIARRAVLNKRCVSPIHDNHKHKWYLAKS
jgi:hypothetical protein